MSANQLIRDLAVNLQVLINVIENPAGGSALAKRVVLLTAQDMVKEAGDYLDKAGDVEPTETPDRSDIERVIS